MTAKPLTAFHRLSIILTIISALSLEFGFSRNVIAQGPGTESGQWTYLGGDAWHTRYSPVDQIEQENFETLEVAWRWDASSFGPSTERSTPSYVDLAT